MKQIQIVVGGNPALVGEAEERAFASNSIGYQISGKVALDGKQYQTNLTLVEVKSKDRVDAEAQALRAARPAAQ